MAVLGIGISVCGQRRAAASRKTAVEAGGSAREQKSVEAGGSAREQKKPQFGHESTSSMLSTQNLLVSWEVAPICRNGRSCSGRSVRHGVVHVLVPSSCGVSAKSSSSAQTELGEP